MSLLFLQETKRETFQKFDITVLTDTQLEATVQGTTDQHATRFIKAVTYHDLKILADRKGLASDDCRGCVVK